MSRDRPAISILLPSYNYGWCLRDAIASVLAQDTTDWELIIIDDGSSDDAPMIAREYARRFPEHISMLAHPRGENRGLPATYRLGRSYARGFYTAFLEADDLWHPRALSVKRQVLDADRSVACVFHDVTMFGDSETLERMHDAFRGLIEGIDIYRRPFCAFPYLMNQNRIPSFSAAMVRRDAFAQIDLPDTHQVWLDWITWAQLSLYGWFYFVPESYTWWRRHEESYNQQYSDGLYASGELELAHLSVQEAIREYARARLPALRREDIRLASEVDSALLYY